ncbi:WG repeat-containing protein [Anaeroselena agilis]|uniref:WG repeat-containing protein n=1 Tax=Anaeroselena agilis TaxID=3063788 RepID=A0ABU3P0D5_9FIRM|nr:WG repeat-containing protein [Selenomonadales bacterium 4137-cl]
MKKLVFILMAALLLGTACPAEGFVNVQVASSAYYLRDDMPLRVQLSGGDKQGLLHIGTGKWVIPPRFEEVKLLSTMRSMGNDYLDIFAVKADGRWGVVDKEGSLLAAPRYSAIIYKGEGLLLAVAGGEYEGAFIPVTKGGKWGVLDRQGRVLIVPRFDYVDDFADGMARVKEGEKYGYIDKDGNLAVPPQYDHTWGFRDGLAIVKDNGKYGYIDKTGKMVIAPQYEYQGAMLFSEGLAAVKVKNKWGYIDKKGTMVIAPQFSEAGYFAGGLAVVRPSGKAGAVNRAGEMVIEPVFDDLILTAGEPAMGLVYINNYTASRYVFIDEFGKPITPWFEGAWDFQEGIAKVRVDGKFGFIDTAGKMVIEPQFSHASRHCQNGMVFVERDGKRGFRDKEGRWLAQLLFGLNSYYISKHQVVWDEDYIYDSDGNKLDHYANHMKDGYHNLKVGLPAEAAKAFRAALRINPGDEAALYGLKLASEN